MMKSRVHAVAGTLGLTLIVLFFTSSIVVEVIGDEHLIARVKTLILFGVLILVPTMATIGATGRALSGQRRSPVIQAKKRRMIAIAAIGLVVLVPCAVTLQRLSAAGDIDATFYAVQITELIGGAVNITLMVMNFRDGRLLAGRPIMGFARSR